MIKARDKKDKLLIISLIIPITILSKFIQMTILPGKYFWDSTRLLSMVTESNTMEAWGGSYEVTADFFRAINIFNFNTLNGWAIFLSTIFTFVIIFMIARANQPDLIQSIYIIAAVALLNIYIFNISKDIIQFAIFFLMYLVIVSKLLNYNLKVFLCFIIFVWESTFFRSYYIIMAALFVILYFIFIRIKRENIKVNKKVVFKVIILMFFSVFAFLFISQFVSRDDYEAVINVRSYNINEIAVSQIENIIESNGTLGIFMVNYVINAIRMMIPVELLLKAVSYAPFVLFQVFVLFYLIKTIKGLNSNTRNEVLITLAVFCAYLLGSFIFEPDFGSFVRHESATFPIFHLIALQKNNRYAIKIKKSIKGDDWINAREK